MNRLRLHWRVNLASLVPNVDSRRKVSFREVAGNGTKLERMESTPYGLIIGPQWFAYHSVSVLIGYGSGKLARRDVG